MKAVQALLWFMVQTVLFAVFINALLIVIGWLFGPWMAHWMAASLAFALSMFVWLLPFAALTMFFVLLLEPIPTSHEG